MISVNDALLDIIQSFPFVEEGLSKGIINYSAFAREIRPQIAKRLYKPVTEGSIVMALKRISDKLIKQKSRKTNINLSDLTVRSNLSEYTFLNSVTLPERISELFNRIKNKRDSVCTLSEGIRETTFVISSDLIDNIEDTLKAEKLVAKFQNLSAITIRLPKEVVHIPGVYYQILKMLAWQNINVIEVLSAYTELTIVIDNKDIDKAFSILKNLNNLP